MRQGRAEQAPVTPLEGLFFQFLLENAAKTLKLPGVQNVLAITGLYHQRFQPDRSEKTLVGEVFKSGNWRGFFLENHRSEKGWMHLHLEFEQNQIRGEGVDYVGPWHIHGEFDAQKASARWEKHYIGKHQVVYEGALVNGRIAGQWQIGHWLSGPFTIWHEQDDMAFAEFESDGR